MELSRTGGAGACRLQELSRAQRRSIGKLVWGGALWEVGHRLGQLHRLLVRSGSGAGGRATRQVEPCNHPACDLVGTTECLAEAWAWLLSGTWAGGS